MTNLHIITDDSQCPIKPEDIDTSTRFMETIWQNMETEISAIWLVKFAQQRVSWTPFTYEELEAFYHTKRPETERFWFNKLTGGRKGDYIAEVDGGDRLAFTTEFVAACYAVNPAQDSIQ